MDPGVWEIKTTAGARVKGGVGATGAGPGVGVGKPAGGYGGGAPIPERVLRPGHLRGGRGRGGTGNRNRGCEGG